MAELITEEQPRIKFAATRDGPLELPGDCSELEQLAQLMGELESCGAVPTLNDGLAAGNCAIAARCAEGTDAEALPPGAIYVSRSGKDPGVVMQPADFVLVTDFQAGSWAARYRSVDAAARPTSDTPLHVAALVCGAQREYGWGEAPAVAVHGHALAEGAGLELAQRLGFPVSHAATLFSTPEDLAELRQLFAAHPYPRHRCYIRRGHGFFLLGASVAEVRRSFRELILPHMSSDGPH